MEMRRKNVLDRGNGKGKCPEVRRDLMCLRNRTKGQLQLSDPEKVRQTGWRKTWLLPLRISHSPLGKREHVSMTTRGVHR